ncbi:MAG: translocation/assembly module TamB domain-containing protein [Tannerellaceae bacterium]|nr:translocation/assembly module TamB domain-containing protein [Tannerellaceae bacterium]
MAVLILFVPPVQNYMLKQALRYAGRKAGLELAADRLRLRLPCELSVENLRASAPGADSLLSLQSLRLGLRPSLSMGKRLAVERLEMLGLSINSGAYVSGTYVYGRLDSLSLSGFVDFKTGHADADAVELSGANVLVEAYPSPDTTNSEASAWTVRLGRLLFSRTVAELRLPADSLGLYAFIPRAEVREINLGLAASLYAAASVAVSDAAVAVESGSGRAASGFDWRHIELTELNMRLDSVEYLAGAMQGQLSSLSVSERSGLQISSLSARARSDSAGADLSEFELRTAHSSLSLQARIPSDALSAEPVGSLEARLSASVGKADLPFFVLPSGDFEARYPDSPLRIELEAKGNSRSVEIPRLQLNLAGALRLHAWGAIARPLDSLRRSARLRLSSRVYQPGLDVTGELDYRRRTAGVELSLSDAARAHLSASFGLADDSYSVFLQVDSLVPAGFTAFDSAAFVSAVLRAQGHGFDFFADSTVANLRGRINELRYANSRLGPVRFRASLVNHKAELEMESDDPVAKMDFSFIGSLSRNRMTGMLSGNVDSLDLYALRLTEAPFSTSFQIFAEAESDLGVRHGADVTLGNWELNLAGSPFRAKTLTLKAHSDADTTDISFNAGDLGVRLSGGYGIEALAGRAGRLAEAVGRRMRTDSAVRLSSVQPLFPAMSLSVHAGKDNPLHAALRRNNIEFDSFSLELSSSPSEGLSGSAGLFALYRDTLRIDTLRAKIVPDGRGLTFGAEVLKNRFLRQTPFTARLQGSLRDEYAEAEVMYTNHRAATGLHLGLRAAKTPQGFLLNFFPDTAVIAFNAFALNSNNSLLFKSIRNIEANLRFSGANNSLLWIHSTKDSATAPYPVLRAELSNIPLGVITRGFISLPSLEGSASADFQYMPTSESFTVAGEVHVDNLSYEGGRVGELMLNGTYIPLAGNTHEVDLHFFRNMNEVSSALAVYDPGRDRLSGSLRFDALPLEMFSAFVPHTTFAGALNGQAEISGTAAVPLATGFLQLDTASVFSGAVSSQFRLDSSRVSITDNVASFNSFRIFASGENPFEINGRLNFADLGRAEADLRLGGNNIRILDAKRRPESIAYGRLLADVSTTIKGSLSALTVRGNVRLLGGTNLTYVMQESPLTVEDRLKDLVTFTSFADSALMRRRRSQTAPLPLGGIDMLMLVHIDPVVQLSADISPDKSSYLNLEGGGDLSFQYNRQGHTVVNGRYTLSGGKLKYALPIIPLKEFGIKPDSYIQWDGDPFNPLLGLAATQRMRSTVSLAGESPRPVDFEVGVDVRERLDNMSLLFTIAAPDDASVQSELDRMGAEGRSTQAVGMMVTGLYLANGSGGKANMDMGDALNSFLQSEINHIAGSALRTVDISFGMDSYNQAPERGGGQRTDYSFRFAKRFYNDRLRIMLGGKLSSGDVPQKEAFIDNASLEWRMNSAGTGYLKLFHDRNYQSILDGEVIETGAGIVLRRRMLRLSELFK